MAKIIKFPRTNASPSQLLTQRVSKSAEQPSGQQARPRSIWRHVIHVMHTCVWIVIVLTWPVWSWIVSIDLLFQAARTVYYWDTPGIAAGGRLALHLLGAAALMTIALRQPGELK